MLLLGVEMDECLVPIAEFLYDYFSEVLRAPLVLLFISSYLYSFF